MKKLLLISTAILFLQGCVGAHYNHDGNTPHSTKINTPPNDPENKYVAQENGDYLYYFIASSFIHPDSENLGVTHTPSEQASAINSHGQMYSFNGEKSLLLSEVVSKMADQLLYNFPQAFHYEALALTSIVDLNDHSRTNWLGQTISEQFIHELHIRNLRVMDFKLTGNIQLTERGEFALTRDWTKLNKNVDVQRVLTGTMSRNEEGVILNIRIVNADSNIVESTSSAFIPSSMFSGGQYDYYQSRRHYKRDSRLIRGQMPQVRLVK